MRHHLVCLTTLILLTGCGGRTSSLLLERRSRGLIADDVMVGRAVAWQLEPVMQTQTQKGIEVNVN